MSASGRDHHAAWRTGDVEEGELAQSPRFGTHICSPPLCPEAPPFGIALTIPDQVISRPAPPKSSGQTQVLTAASNEKDMDETSTSVKVPDWPQDSSKTARPRNTQATQISSKVAKLQSRKSDSHAHNQRNHLSSLQEERNALERDKQLHEGEKRTHWRNVEDVERKLEQEHRNFRADKDSFWKWADREEADLSYEWSRLRGKEEALEQRDKVLREGLIRLAEDKKALRYQEKVLGAQQRESAEIYAEVLRCREQAQAQRDIDSGSSPTTSPTCHQAKQSSQSQAQGSHIPAWITDFDINTDMHILSNGKIQMTFSGGHFPGLPLGHQPQTNPVVPIKLDAITRLYIEAYAMNRLNQVFDGTEWRNISSAPAENSELVEECYFVWVAKGYWIGKTVPEQEDDDDPTKYISTPWGYYRIKLRPFLIVGRDEGTIFGLLCTTHGRRSFGQVSNRVTKNELLMQRVEVGGWLQPQAREPGCVRIAEYRSDKQVFISKHVTELSIETPMSLCSGYIIEDDRLLLDDMLDLYGKGSRGGLRKHLQYSVSHQSGEQSSQKRAENEALSGVDSNNVSSATPVRAAKSTPRSKYPGSNARNAKKRPAHEILAHAANKRAKIGNHTEQTRTNAAGRSAQPNQHGAGSRKRTAQGQHQSSLGMSKMRMGSNPGFGDSGRQNAAFEVPAKYRGLKDLGKRA